ncbi:MAG: hypothetical protein KDA62_08935, partial [Planctomycetales bacterium]|nr:hypothetical protein [Planctomycetales bacterium]
MMKRLAAVFPIVVCLAFGVARAEEIGFIEDFSLATDRTVPLRQLIPGTEDYYYFHALHHQNTGDHAKVAELLDAWIKRYGYTQRVQEIRYRQALLTYQQTPQQSLSFIRQELNLQFNHQRQELDRKPNLPTRLDQQAIGREAFTQRAMSRYQNLQGFEDSALDWLVSTELNADRLRNLLQRLERPDQPKLPELIVADLNHPN